MSDNIRRLRWLQRATTEERVTRGAAERALGDLAEFCTMTATCIGRGDGLNDAINLDEFSSLVTYAREAAEVHAKAYAQLTEIQEGES